MTLLSPAKAKASPNRSSRLATAAGAASVSQPQSSSFSGEVSSRSPLARVAALFVVIVLLSALITSKFALFSDGAATTSGSVNDGSKGLELIKSTTTTKDSSHEPGENSRFIELGRGKIGSLLHWNNVVGLERSAVLRPQTAPSTSIDYASTRALNATMTRTASVAGIPKDTGHRRGDRGAAVVPQTALRGVRPPESAGGERTGLTAVPLARESAHKEAIEMIKCHNQTDCIAPETQLKKTYDVYYCKHLNYGVRFFYLVREGLLLHPRIRLVDNPHRAEVIVYLPVSADWEKTECNNPIFKNKTVVLDEGDYQQLFEPASHSLPNSNIIPTWLLYFKRSYVRRDNGIFNGYMNYIKREDVLPMTYTIADAYVKTDFNRMKGRDIDIVCTLRGSSHDPTRERVKQWVQQYAKKSAVTKYIAGEVNSASRTVVSKGYFDQLYRAKIIVTSNPSNWEGDFRLMEAFASGALIFVDYMYVPRPQPLLDNKHVVFYNNNNKTDLFTKLDFYRQSVNLQKAKKIAVNGYLHTMRYHRAANLIDYVFRTIHCKSDAEKCKLYSATGYEMRKKAIHIHNEAERQKKEWEKRRAADSPLVKKPQLRASRQSRDPLELPNDHNTHTVHGNQQRA